MTQRRESDYGSRNDWRRLAPRPLGTAPQTVLDMSVVLPAHNCQGELDLTLASLATQTHPQQNLEVVVVDDKSDPPLELPALRPDNTRIVRTTSTGHGSGVARDTGARVADGQAILFLDSDILADSTHVEAHARWHEITPDAVVLGFRDFVDVDGLTVQEVVDANRGAGIATILPERERTPHAWIESLLAATGDLTTDREDLWRPVVGASVSTSRDLYLESGGFAHFTRRGIVDIEFGYRAFTAGGLIVPERAAYSIHQGQRTASTRGAELTRMRAPLIANHIASKRYRPTNRGRQWVVPYLHVIVPAGKRTFRHARQVVDDLLMSEFDDLVVTVQLDPANPDMHLFEDYWAADSRVRLTEDEVLSGFPSPATSVVPVGTRLDPASLGNLVDRLRRWEHGLVSALVPGVESSVEMWSTRALHRSRRASQGRGTSVRKAVKSLFGEETLLGAQLGLSAEQGASDRGFKDELFYPGEP